MCAFLQLEHQAFPLQNLLWDVAHDGHSTPDVTISPRVVTKPKVASIENTGLQLPLQQSASLCRSHAAATHQLVRRENKDLKSGGLGCCALGGQILNHGRDTHSS